jgi:hypothetical protein
MDVLPPQGEGILVEDLGDEIEVHAQSMGICGHSFFDIPDDLRSTSLGGLSAMFRGNSVGFRVARTVRGPNR